MAVFVGGLVLVGAALGKGGAAVVSPPEPEAKNLVDDQGNKITDDEQTPIVTN